MNHYLITRFNLKVAGWNSTRDGDPITNTEWLSHRFELFEKYCFPSIRNQSDQDFTWLVFFDSNTPEVFKNRIENFAKSFPNFQPLFISSLQQLIPTTKQVIAKSSSTSFIITSRVDNDDLLHRDYIKVVKFLAKEEDGLVIDLRKGYQLINNQEKNEIRLYRYKFNPFISLVEHRSCFKSVMQVNHSDWKRSKSIVVEKHKRLWIEHVHSKNKLNDQKPYLFLSMKRDWTDFGMLDSMNCDSFFSILMQNAGLGFKKIARRVGV
ncbi:MAG: glycosyltransferase [Bacteroidota bacterium]|uniref:Rhamnosyl transferase n=1 Tax=Roseivirga thermotolerans TaxID=1758176 RepID=A0ABQ3I756_9BACT|nr:glycosyltransferase [Roseivirga thermotolerans]MEC7754760.1 glycosyltransferase [Bacteroidota bacterium]GHE68605.1 hypothetical protein GCM10011340_25510 [Roseivirga thermotolerans]